jgi:hypothetical protein
MPRHPRATVPALAVALLLAPASLAAQWTREGVSADRDAAIPVGGASVVAVEARAGSLRIEGRAGVDEVRARGTARASSREVLEQVRLVTERRGDQVTVVVETPRDLRDGEWAALDLVVEVPRELALDVTDGSGDLEIRSVGALRLIDGSGGIELEGIGGALRIQDGSGEIRVRDARGDVEVQDGSGEIELAGVQGSVRVHDGSGELDVRDVGRDVVIERKGSGEITVERVRGDLLVDRGVRRTVRHADVQGRVDVPPRRSRRDDR